MPLLALVKPTARNPRRTIQSWLVALLSVLVIFSIIADSATAARRRGSSRGRSRQSLAAAKAYKAKAAQSIQRQLDAARNVLANAESQAAISEATVSNAISQLSDIRVQIENAHDDVAQAAKTLHELEKEILADQLPNSELIIAQEVLRQAKNTMHDALHRVFNILHESGVSDETARLREFESLSDEQKVMLEKDPSYQVAQRDMQTAAAQVTRLRRELFLADKQWVDARQELTDADKSSREGTRQATTTGMNMFGGQQKLRSNRQVAAAARSVIAQGEARLRQLGASTTSSPNKKKK